MVNQSSYRNRPCPGNCPKPEPVHEIPRGNRMELLHFIDLVSFAVYDTLLYLDTHPEDKKAMKYYLEQAEQRRRAVHEYEKNFGPLLSNHISETESGKWKWVYQPWPWEGGKC